MKEAIREIEEILCVLKNGHAEVVEVRRECATLSLFGDFTFSLKYRLALRPLPEDVA